MIRQCRGTVGAARLASVLDGNLWPLLGGLLYATFTQILWST